MITMTYGFLISGTVLVEVVFTWPGLGLYAVNAMDHSDYEPVLGVVLFTTAFYLLALHARRHRERARRSAGEVVVVTLGRGATAPPLALGAGWSSATARRRVLLTFGLLCGDHR